MRSRLADSSSSRSCARSSLSSLERLVCAPRSVRQRAGHALYVPARLAGVSPLLLSQVVGAAGAAPSLVHGLAAVARLQHSPAASRLAMHRLFDFSMEEESANEAAAIETPGRDHQRSQQSSAPSRRLQVIGSVMFEALASAMIIGLSRISSGKQQPWRLSPILSEGAMRAGNTASSTPPTCFKSRKRGKGTTAASTPLLLLKQSRREARRPKFASILGNILSRA
eukprot:CAMPEP_0169421854 /NCGR_PEP_ID=MMETSP1017-20121227/66540_1 /TAXON_ID=342587 /ORGANISM="Karlodinium micrum, Strain CCMP2283" /LENGTH=224 /DNA_ID=CAMNT_0009531221 /DNA_START=362 /DNA_END=1033 /DNA_ORIENTATION=-